MMEPSQLEQHLRENNNIVTITANHSHTPVILILQRSCPATTVTPSAAMSSSSTPDTGAGMDSDVCGTREDGETQALNNQKP